MERSSGRKSATAIMKKKAFKLPPGAIMPKAGDAAKYGLNLDPLTNRPGLHPLGALPTTTSLNVRQSIIRVGYETLDRDTFDPGLSYKLMAETGVKWARVQTGWKRRC